MMTVKADDRRRVVIQDAEPGQVFAYSADGEAITLTRLKEAEPRRVQAKLSRKGGRMVFVVPKGLELAEDAIPRTLPR